MKKFTRLLCVAVLLFAAICVPVAAYEVSVPEQDEDGYYLIGTAEELFWYATEGAKLDEIINVKLTADINVNPDYKIHDNGKVTYADGSKIPGVTFTVTDESTVYFKISDDAEINFRDEFLMWDYDAPVLFANGVFDGQNHTISGLYSAGENAGGLISPGFPASLFSTVKGTVKNLGITNSFLCGYANYEMGGAMETSSLCHANYGIIENCYSDVDVYNGENAAGLVLYNYGIIRNCYYTGRIQSFTYGGASAICHTNFKDALIENCYNAGNAIGQHSTGICASNSGRIEGCYNGENGSVEGSYTSGICRANQASGIIENCYNQGNVGSSWGGSFSGVCYTNMGTVTGCYNSYSSAVAQVDGMMSGIVYENTGTITKCYNTGSFSAPGAQLAGICLKNNRNGIIENCYNTGSISTTNFKAAGISIENTAGTVRNCYNTGSVTARYYSGAIVAWQRSGTVNNNYYLSGCAKDVSGTIQQGIGAATTGSITSHTSSYTRPLTIGEFSSGKAAYLLRTNGTVAGEWTQTLPAQLFPGFDGKAVEYNSVTDTYYNSTEGITIAGGGAELILTKNLVQVNKVRIPGQLILASYSREGQLLDAVIVPVYADTDITFTGSGLDTNGAYSVRAMVFMNMIDLLPMCEAKSVNL